MDPDFVGGLFELISDMVNPRNISIEITESVFASNCDNVNNTLEKLRTAGFHIAIDDFWSGYSSLSRENKSNVDCMKINKYFIDRLLDTKMNKAITSDIISIAHKLGHCTIAEGVEHESQFQYLRVNSITFIP